MTDSFERPLPRTEPVARFDDGERAPVAPVPSVETGRDPSDTVGEEIRLRLQRQAERVQQTAADVQIEAQRRVETVQLRASRLRTQLEFKREKRDPIRHRLSILTARLVSWLAWALPQPLRLRLAVVIGWFVFRYNRGFRDNVRANLLHVLGPDTPEERISETSRRIARNGILNILDLLIVHRQSADEVVSLLDIDPEFIRQLDQVGRDARGTIVITAHLGSFDMIGQAMAALDYPTTVLTGRTTYRVLFDAMSFLRQSGGGKVVEPTPSGVREIFRALRRGDIVGIVSDRDFFQNGLPVRFFGAETTLPPGPVRIARDTGALILPAFARRNGQRHEIRVLPAFRVPRTSDAQADVAEGMASMIAALEQEIAREPEQWSIFQRVWPDEEAVVPSGS